MNNKFCLHFISLIFLFSLLACNATKENVAQMEETIAPKTAFSKADAPTNTPKKKTYADYQNFKKLSLEEQWKTLSPARRNYLREHPNVHPQFKKMIAAEPDMETLD